MILFFVAGASSSFFDGATPRIYVTRGIIMAFYGFTLFTLPLLFKHDDGSRLTRGADCQRAFAYCLAFMATTSAALFDKSDTEYWFRLVWIVQLTGAAWLLWTGYILWRRRG